MIKLLIADDEQIVLDSLKFIIERYCHEVEIVGFARSGREAIEKVDLYNPDIVFMDIKMPGINGIDAIKNIKEDHSDIIFIIITAYDYFKYAKDAIDLDVLDYLLKPINKNKVIETINKAINIIKSNKENIQKKLELQEKIAKILPTIESSFIYSIMSGLSMENYYEFYKEIFEVELDFGYALVFYLDKIETGGKSSEINERLDFVNFYEHVKNTLKDNIKCLVGPLLFDKIPIFVPINKKDNLFDIKNSSIEYLEKVRDNLKKETKIPFRVGIGRPYSIDNFIKSYDEAEIAIKICSGVISHFDDVAIPDKIDLYPIQKNKMLIDYIVMGDGQGANVVFNEIINWILSDYGEDINRIKSKLIELFIDIVSSINIYVDVRGSIESDFLLNFIECKEINQIKRIYDKYLHIVVDEVKKSRIKKYKGLVSKAIEYINMNFDKDIKLHDVAKVVNMSYHYFSKFFKDETNKNFVDYLTEVRINKAKKYIADGKLTIKEISYKVGYSDPNYFSRIFKKATGIAPTDYKNIMSSDGGIVNES